MSIECDETTMPVYWASYLVNGDASGMEDEEIAACDEYLARALPDWSVVGIVEDSERFTWHYPLYGGTAQGGTVCDYIIHRPS